MIRMHRLILKAQKGQQVDHINGNGLDNRKDNLRFCTSSQNYQNSRKRKNCSSKYKGVWWHKQSKKWQTGIVLNYKNYHLGYFTNEIEAAKAYDLTAAEFFGEFARLNRDIYPSDFGVPVAEQKQGQRGLFEGTV